MHQPIDPLTKQAFLLSTIRNPNKTPLLLSPSVCTMFCFINRKWVVNASIRRSLLLSLMQNRFLNTTTTCSTLTSTSSSSSSSFAFQYLTNSCGLPLQPALSASKKLQLNEDNLQKAQFVVEFLKSQGFNDTQIAQLIQKWPAVLLCRVDNNLAPKFEFLIRNGFTGQRLPELILSNPMFFKMGLDARIKPNYEFLKSFLRSNEKVALAIKRSSSMLTYNLMDTMQPNIVLLMNQGVPLDVVNRMLVYHPRAMIQRNDRMIYAVGAVKKLGLDPRTIVFVQAVGVMLSMSDSSWKAKVDLMKKSMGWNEEEVLLAFKRYPPCMGCSEEKIRIYSNLYLNTMKLNPEIIIRYPILLKYAIDKRIRPRYSVIKALQSKGLIKEDVKIECLLLKTEKYFLHNYVSKYADKVPDLLEIYGCTNNTRNTHP